MKLPMHPPPLHGLFGELREEGRLAAVLGHGKAITDGRYLHWDELRHRKPPGDLTHAEWWFATRLARTTATEAMPLLDKEGRPFGLVHAAPIRQALHQVDQRFGMTGRGSGTPSDVRTMVDAHGHKYLLANSLMEEAIRSSQLEGASTTRARAKDMIRERRPPADRSERMILNNFFAMEKIEDLASGPLTVDTVLQLHSVLVDGTLDDPTRAGVFRREEDQVVVELLHSIETAHVPPPASELTDRMLRILAFANGERPEEWLHPVLRATILHFMIGYDHPFVDGNGRMARVLFYWAMLRYGYPLTRFLSISRVLREAPAKYARAYLFTETDGGDLTYFVDHQLQVILQSIDALAGYVARKAASTRAVEEELRASPDLNHRQIQLLGHALRHPGFEYTVRSHQSSHRVVTNTARADLDGLAARGLLVKSRRGRRHVFIAPRDLEGRVRG